MRGLLVLICVGMTAVNVALIDGGADGIRWLNVASALVCAGCTGWSLRCAVEL